MVAKIREDSNDLFLKIVDAAATASFCFNELIFYYLFRWMITNSEKLSDFSDPDSLYRYV